MINALLSIDESVISLIDAETCKYGIKIIPPVYAFCMDRGNIYKANALITLREPQEEWGLLCTDHLRCHSQQLQR